MIHCESLYKSFNEQHVLVDVNLQFPTSGIVAVIGPNGAGKTTLLNIVTGFLPPDTGRCYFKKHEITGLPPYRIARLGIARTFQDLRLVPQIPVLENVLLARPGQKGESLLDSLLRIGVSQEEVRNREEAMRLLQFVGLDGVASELAGELSYGQQKLLTMACCLATGAQALLLDEPVSGVQPEMILHILNLLRSLRDDGRLVVFIEHNIDAVHQVADSVVVMDEGRVIAQGLTRDVLGRADILETYLV
jgi:ABC-type branched-subunit amino acid transport system ATPase component